MANRIKSYMYEIPEGYEARIEGNKVIIELAESEDEKIRKWLTDLFSNRNEKFVQELDNYRGLVTREQILTYLEKQKPLSTEETELNSIAFLEQMGYTFIPPGVKPVECKDCAMFLNDKCERPGGKCEKKNQKLSWSEEDEEIRQELIGGLMWQRDNLKAIGSHDNNSILPGFTMKVGNIIDYLRKQKDRMTAEEFESSELFQLKLKTKYADGYQDGLAQKEQKPKKRPKFKIGDVVKFKGFGDEPADDTPLKIVGYDNELYLFDNGTTDLFSEQNLYELVEQEPEEWNFPYGVNETVDRLVSLAECLEMDGDCLFNEYSGTEYGKFLRELARKQVECKPEEWSEEDETKLNDVIRIIENSGLVESIRNHYVKFLKSLRPSWKPSELEKGALRTAIHILTDERNFPKAAAQLQNILNAFE